MNLIEKDKAYIWHPFTQMKTAGDPVLIKKAKGSLLYDGDDNEYIDAISSWWVNVHGHAHPYIAKRIYEQLTTLEHVIFAGFTHPPAIELCERILNYLPHQSKVFFSDNGSTAIEIALKMCLQFHYNQDIKKDTIIALEGAYHGDTFGAMSTCAEDGFNNPFKAKMFDVERISVPTENNLKKSIEQLKNIIKTKEVCCFIFEPLIQGASGMVMYEPEALDELIQICHDNNVLCIADEVMTGFYRTGKMFASDYLKNKPDITCLSKGLTGGTLPLSLTTCTQEIYDAFWSDDKKKTFFHGHSFTGNPIGCAASLASLDLFEREETQQDIQRIVASHAIFKKQLEAHPMAENVRQRGTIIALEFKTEADTSYFNNIRDKLYHFFLENGVLLRPLGNVVYVLPPYCITDEQLKKVYGLIIDALDGDWKLVDWKLEHGHGELEIKYIPQ
jgi:adenosylmethionine-8-amino-7-oxononanoate aminotransferase